jgi:uncharacterized membrane protein YidH (DUF202 family)
VKSEIFAVAIAVALIAIGIALIALAILDIKAVDQTPTGNFTQMLAHMYASAIKLVTASLELFIAVALLILGLYMAFSVSRQSQSI